MVDMSSSSTTPSPPPRLPAEEGPSDAGTTGGFVARMGGVSLMDLIQFECQRGGQRILRVTSRGQSGYLYFRGGALVHAATAVFTGTAAVREMLGWHSGSIESGQGDAPPHESIPPDWRSLLSPGQKAAFVRAQAPVEAPPAEHPTVVLAPTGQLLSGGEVIGLPEAASYAAHMAELIGGFLGFDRFCALEASYGREQLLVARARTGNLLARREKNPADLDDLRREVAEDAGTPEGGKA
jgi:hypothetical protein